ncbi:hypothetical protein [Novosphingobium terrae]|uniref:hypothetical protein n=1 Tax=Novosphingobium terrae TaxID=2726189 RepID=UPI001980B164|nr:hypothetical protein [Novosphingobium terrae]
MTLWRRLHASTSCQLFEKLTADQIAGLIVLVSILGELIPKGAYATARIPTQQSAKNLSQGDQKHNIRKFVENIDRLSIEKWNFYPVNERSRTQALDLATKLAGEGMKLHPTDQPFQQANIFDFIKVDEPIATMCKEVHFDMVATQISMKCKNPDEAVIDALPKILGKPITSTEGPVADPHGTKIPKVDQIIFYTTTYRRKGGYYIFSGQKRGSFDELRVTVISK